MSALSAAPAPAPAAASASARPVIEWMTIEVDELTGKFAKKEQVAGQGIDFFKVTLPADVISSWDFLYWLKKNSGDARIEYKGQNNYIINILLPLIPWLLIFGFIWFFVFRQLRNSAGAGGMLGNFGRSRHKITSKEHTNVTFDDVAGVEEA